MTNKEGMKVHLSISTISLVLYSGSTAVGFTVSRPPSSLAFVRPTIGALARWYVSTSHATAPRQQTSISPNAERGGTDAKGSVVGEKKMILRPDWERDGRVFGLSPQVLKDRNQAARLAEGLLQQGEKRKERAFEYLVSYPCDFIIKVIGVNEGSFADDIAATVSNACQVRERFVYAGCDDAKPGRRADRGG